MISNISSLIIFVRTCLPNHGMNFPVNLFLDLCELKEGVKAANVFSSLMNCLQFNGMTKQYLKDHLISLSCDGAAVMLGRLNGVAKLMRDEFPSLIVWHCANHRLELAVNETVKCIGEINKFKGFVDKLYALYHASPKNFRDLKTCASLLEEELFKIGRILNTRWVASSFRSVLATWKSYVALVEHFNHVISDDTGDKNDKSKFSGLLKKFTSTAFVLDLALMCDALQELSELSLDLQNRDISLISANQKIENLVQIFERRITEPGAYYEMASEAVNKLSFFGVKLHNESGRNKQKPIDPTTFYSHLAASMKDRLLESDDKEIAQACSVLIPEKWPNEVEKNITFGEKDIRTLTNKFHLNERSIIRSFRDYLVDKKMPKDLIPLINAVNTIAVSTSECERGFSQMNLVMTPQRASLAVKTVSSILVIKFNGPPLHLFNPSKYVDSWLLKKHHSATDTNSKVRNRDQKYDENLVKIWKLL